MRRRILVFLHQRILKPARRETENLGTPSDLSPFSALPGLTMPKDRIMMFWTEVARLLRRRSQSPRRGSGVTL